MTKKNTISSDQALVADTHAAMEALRETYLALPIDDLLDKVRSLSDEAEAGKWIPDRFSDDAADRIGAFEMAATVIRHALTTWESDVAASTGPRRDAVKGIANAIAALEVKKRGGAA